MLQNVPDSDEWIMTEFSFLGDPVMLVATRNQNAKKKKKEEEVIN